MDIKLSRLFLFIVACSITGVILGGTASQAELNRCQTASNPTSECLTKDPIANTIEGMSVGLLAGAGAAFGATYQIWQQKGSK